MIFRRPADGPSDESDRESTRKATRALPTEQYGADQTS
jgi:hypothetical protein